MTRAKSGLIVIGDSQTLRHDRHWKAFVDYCRKEGCYTSLNLSPETVAKLYTSVEPVHSFNAPRPDDRTPRESRFKAGPLKTWKPTRVLPGQEVESDNTQESAVGGMQK